MDDFVLPTEGYLSTNEYDGNWISTLHVKNFHFLDPQPDEIDIRDIAHALSLTCRFGGHCMRFYSVAEHSIRVSQMVEYPSRLSALLHDASEAYIPDIPRPIKKHCENFVGIYKKIDSVLLYKFGATCADWGAIKKADNRMLITEAKALGVYNSEWADLGEPYDIPISGFGWSPRKAEQSFTSMFRRLER